MIVEVTTRRKGNDMGGMNAAAVQPDAFQELEIPFELEETFRRHREHLAHLVVSLQAAGVHSAQIEQSITVIVASYKAELIDAMKRLV
jgi:hypothetical protein